MNALLPIFLILLLFGGDKTRGVGELLSRVDFASFKPVFDMLGVKKEIVDFLSSDEFSKMLENGKIDPSSLMKLASSFSAGRNGKDEKTGNEAFAASPAETANKLSPVENVVPEEIENSISGYFS